MKLALAALLVALPFAPVHGADTVACAIEGDRIHWIADYCMAKLQTDDEIAASACIEAASRMAFPDECAARRHYKRALCEMVIANGARSGSVEKCLDDPGFVGPTVEHQGVGG